MREKTEEKVLKPGDVIHCQGFVVTVKTIAFRNGMRIPGF